MSTFYVYQLSRPWNGVPCYIGKGRGNRAQSHARLGEHHYNTHLAAIFQKAGSTPVPVTIIAKGLTEDEAFALEIKLIAEIGRAGLKEGPLANQTAGGDGTSGRVTSAETKAKLKAAFDIAKRAELSARMTAEKRAQKSAEQASVWTPEKRAAHGAHRKGIAHTKEHRERIREAWTSEKKAAKSVAQKIAMTPELRATQSKMMSARVVAAETKAKMSIARKAYWERKRQERASV